MLEKDKAEKGQDMYSPDLYDGNYAKSGAIIGDGDRKSWDSRGPMIWDNFSIFRTNCAMLT